MTRIESWTDALENAGYTKEATSEHYRSPTGKMISRQELSEMFQSAVGNLGIQHVNQYLQAGNYSHSYGNQTALVQGQSPYSGTSAIFYPNANSIIGTNPAIVLMQLYIPNSNRWIDIYINVADVGTINYINTYLQAAFLPKADPIPTDSGNGDFSIEEIEKAQEIFRELETATGLP